MAKQKRSGGVPRGTKPKCSKPPSPAEIKRRAAAIRAGWTPAEAAARWQGPLTRAWTPPEVAVGEVWRQRDNVED